MKTLLVTYSYHHHNTLKIAKTMNNIFNGLIKKPDEIKDENLSEYDLIGFGAGIDSGKHYQELLDFAQSINIVVNQPCFIFSTSAVQGEKKVYKDHTALREILEAKGYNVLDEFSCKGYNTNLFLKYFGGMNKGRPNTDDQASANQFAIKIASNFK